MKLAVITLHRVHNYGTVLQAYATQFLLEQRGHEVVLIDYITEKRRLKNLIKMNYKKRGPVKGTAKVASLLFREYQFNRFICRNINLTKKYISFYDLKSDPPKADIYVTGSDQTWNAIYNDGIDPGFFLQFIDDSFPKVAFGASFGREKLEIEEESKTYDYLKSYQHISVREKTALDILTKIGITEAEYILDPTLLVPKEIWLQMAGKLKPAKPYVMLFLLYQDECNAAEYARIIAQERGLEVVKLSWEWKKTKFVDRLYSHKSPELFLALMAHADFVVTNSFHGLAFAINFEKDFLVEERSMFNTRIESLLECLELQERMVPRNFEEKQDGSRNGIINKLAHERIDYQSCRKKIEMERRKADSFVSKWFSLKE